MRPGSFVDAARRGRCPALPGEQLLLTRTRAIHELPHAIAQNLGRGSALRTACRHEFLAKVAFYSQPQNGIFDFQGHGYSVTGGYTFVYPVIDGYSPVEV